MPKNKKKKNLYKLVKYDLLSKKIELLKSDVNHLIYWKKLKCFAVQDMTIFSLKRKKESKKGDKLFTI